MDNKPYLAALQKVITDVIEPAAIETDRAAKFPRAAIDALSKAGLLGLVSAKEIQKNWKSQGRGANADNSISQLFKQKKLKRTPLKDQPGSRYTIL